MGVVVGVVVAVVVMVRRELVDLPVLDGVDGLGTTMVPATAEGRGVDVPGTGLGAGAAGPTS